MQGVKIQVPGRWPVAVQIPAFLCIFGWLYYLTFPNAPAWLKYAYLAIAVVGPLYIVIRLAGQRWKTLFGTRAELGSVKRLIWLGNLLDMLALVAILPWLLPLLEERGKMRVDFPVDLHLWFWGACLAVPLCLWLRTVVDSRLRYWAKRCAPDTQSL